MALDFQHVDIAFTQGLDTHTNKKLVVPGKWNLLNNCTLSVDGSLTKRDGVSALNASALGNGVATFNNELLVVKGSSVQTVVSPTGDPAIYPASTSAVTGQVGFVDVTKTQIRANSGYQEGMDCAYGLGFTAYVWNDFTAAGAFNGTYLTVIDESSGAVALAATQMNAAGNQPRVVYSQSAFFVFYRVAATLRCRVVTMSAGTLTYGTETVLIAANFTAANFDSCEFMQSPPNGSVGVSYAWNDGVTSVRAIRVTQAAGVPSIATGPVNLITEAEMNFAGVMGIGVCWMNSSATGSFATFAFGTAGALAGTTVKILDNTFASAAAATLVDATVPAVGTACHVCASGEVAFNVAVCFTDQQSSVGGAAAVQPLRRTEILLAAGVVTVISSATLINSIVAVGGAAVIAPPQGPFICGKPISLDGWDSSGVGTLVNGRLFLPVCTISYYAATVTSTINQQNAFFLLDAVSGEVVSKALYGTYGIPAQFAIAPLVYTPCSISPIGYDGPNSGGSAISLSQRYVLACTERGKLTFQGNINVTQTGLVRLAFEPRLARPPIRSQLGAATYFAGGAPSLYDGQGVTEVGFPLFPEGIAAVVSAGGAMTVGVHQVVAVYEWVDGQGQRHQSSPSLPVSFTITGGNQTATFTCPTLHLSQKAGISVVFYVTQAAGLAFNRVTSMAAPVLNTTAAASVNQAFALVDADFAGNELLYTQPLQSGTTLPNDSPGPSSVLAVHQNRLWMDLTDQQGAYRYSQLLAPPTGLQWNSVLGGTVPVDGGPIIGFSAMDELIVIFCARKIYRITGTGPTPSGGFSNYSEPVEIPSDVGCSEPRSILKLPNGVIFKSLKGWQMLGRDLSVNYIGEGASAYDDFAVMSATLLESEQEARFTTAFTGSHIGDGGAVGRTLVYSYLINQWSTAVINFNSGAATRTVLAYDSVWWPSQQKFITVSLVDGLNYDKAGSLQDLPGLAAAASPVQMTARTSFLHLPGLEGFQRVRWLYLTASFATGTTGQIGVTFTVDFDDAYSAVTPPGAPGAYSTTGSQLLSVYGAGLSIDFRHKLHRQKCKSVAFTFTDIEASNGVHGINGFQALAIEVGLKRGTNKLSAAQTVA